MAIQPQDPNQPGQIYPTPLHIQRSCDGGKAVINVFSDTSYGDTRVIFTLYSDSQYSQQVASSGVINISDSHSFKGLDSNKTYYIEAYGDVSTYNRRSTITLSCTPPPLSLSFKAAGSASAVGASDGWLEVAPAGGYAPYRFQLKKATDPDSSYTALQDSARFNGLKAGSYVVRGADSTGATATLELSVKQPKYILLETVIGDYLGDCYQPYLPGSGAYACFYAITDYLFNSETEAIEVREYKVEVDESQDPAAYNWLIAPAADFYGYCLPDTTKRRWFDYLPATKALQVNEADAETCGYVALPCTIELSQVSVTPSSSAEAPDGAIEAVATTAYGPLQYSLDGATWQDSGRFTGLAPGVYAIQARDANDCQATATATVSLIVPCTLETQPLEVIGDSVLVLATSENLPITYSWDGGETFTEDWQKGCLPYGPGSVIVKDANNCQAVLNYSIEDPELTDGGYFIYFLVIGKTFHRIEEPQKFDAIELQLSRDKTLHGVNYEYDKLPLGFDCQAGYDLIRQQYRLHGSDAEIGFKVFVRECDSCIFELEYSGRLNMTDYSNRSLESIEANVEQSTLVNVFNKSFKSKVDLLDPAGLSGQLTDAIGPSPLTLHSRAIVKNYEAYANDPYFVSELIENGQGKVDPYIVFGFNNIAADGLKKVNQTNTGFSYIQGRYAIFEPEEIGVFDLDFYANLDIVVHRNRGDFDEAEIRIYYQLNDGAKETLARYHSKAVHGSLRQNLQARVNRRLSLNPGDKVYFYGELNIRDRSGNYQFTYEVGLKPTSYIRISGATELYETTSKAFPIYEAMAKVISAATGESDALRSRFFGRTDSIPRAYTSDGCGGLYSLLSGLLVRGVDTKGFSLSMQDIIDGVNPIFNIGVAFGSENGKEVIEIEAAESFYKDEEIIAFSSISDYSEDVAADLVYNTVKVGFSKWEPDGRVENGLDEPNARREWVTPIKNHAKEYKAESKFIAGGYLLEAQRRAGITNNDSRNDNDVFIVASERTGSSFVFIMNYDTPTQAVLRYDNAYAFSPILPGQTISIAGANNGRFKVLDITYKYVWISYPFPGMDIYTILHLDRPVSDPAAIYADRVIMPGPLKSEKGTAFGVVRGLFSPETAYNLRITPARIFRNHALFLNSGAFFKAPEELYRSTYGEGNIVLETQFNDGESCLLGDVSRSLVAEAADVAIKDARNGEKLYEPLYISFTTELSREEFARVRSKRHGYVRAWNGEEWVKGYIFDAKYRISERKCKFKLLKAATPYDPNYVATREFNEREFNNREFN